MLRDALLQYSKKGDLWYAENEAIRCVACGHRCRIFEGRDGICKVRSNIGQKLKVPWGYIGALQIDPIEKKPFFHALPSAKTLSFGMLGCDFHCAYCQNWFTSQSLRDPNSKARPRAISADELCELAIKSGASVLTSTYNEPLITSEWAAEIFRTGQKHNLRACYVSNGNGTKEVLEYIRPYLHFYKVDLKSFNDKSYRTLGGVLKNILDTIESIHAMGIWLEIVTLVIPGFNDSDEEITSLCKYLVGVSKNIPLHLTAFHKDYKMCDPENTSASQLCRSAEIAKAEGLNFVYAGNLPGQVGKWENTFCQNCHKELIERSGYRILANRIIDSKCPDCYTIIPGVWQ